MTKLFVREGRKIKVSPRIYAWAIGVGLVLFSVHTKYLTYTNADGITSMFLPWVGFAIILLALMFLFSKKDFKWHFGSRYVWIPMLVIVGSVIISELLNHSIMIALASILFVVTLFALYGASRTLGKDVFVAFIPAVILEAISCIVLGIVYPGVRNGGFITHSGNFDIATGLLIFGIVVSVFRGQWWLTAIALVGLFFTGAEEAVFCMVVLTVALLIRRDWSKRLLVPVISLLLVLAVCTPLGITHKLYNRTPGMVSATSRAIVTAPSEMMTVEWNETVRIGLGDRADDYYWVIKNFRFFGHGYNINKFYEGIPHNVPLIILNQLGILAMLAWLWIMGYCLVRTKWKYAVVGILALGTFDHFMWTQVAPWWWALAGVATASDIKSDLIFKEV